MRSSAAPLLLLAFLAAFPLSAFGQAGFSTGDVVVGDVTVNNTGITGFIDRFVGGSALRLPVSPGFTEPFSLGFHPDGQLLSGGVGVIKVYNSTGQTGTFGPLFGSTFVTGITRDAAGNLYVAQAFQIVKLSAGGTVLQTFVIPGPGSAGNWRIDLGADQCTMYAVAEGFNRVLRHDVCANSPLAELGSFPDEGLDLRVLSDGSVLVAGDSGIYRIAANGVLVHTYTLPAGGPYPALAVDLGGAAFWAGSPVGVVRLDLFSGTPTAGPLVPRSFPISAISVAGEPRAALIAAAAVPIQGPIAVVLLTIVLMVIAIVRLRQLPAHSNGKDMIERAPHRPGHDSGV